LRSGAAHQGAIDIEEKELVQTDAVSPACAP
jgi:hypothetical protein